LCKIRPQEIRDPKEIRLDCATGADDGSVVGERNGTRLISPHARPRSVAGGSAKERPDAAANP